MREEPERGYNRRLLRVFFGGLVGLGLFIGDCGSAVAVSVNIDELPETVSAEPFMVGVTVDGANEGTNYLRVDLYQDGTKNYFGETFNGLDWYGGSDGKQYWPVVIGVDHKISTTVQARVGTPSEKYFVGDGLYKLRVRRYTASGSQSSGDQQNTADVRIVISTPVPSAETSPTASAVPSVVPTLLPTAARSLSPVPSPSLVAPRKVASGTVLYPAIFASPTDNPGQKKVTPSVGVTTVTGSTSGQITLATLSAGVLGFSTVSPSTASSPLVAGESLDRKVPLVISGIGLVLVIIGFWPHWRRKIPRPSG